MKLVQRLASKCGTEGGFQWKDLGRSCGACFNSVPERVGFLAGPLDAELPDKKKAANRERRKREPAAKVAEVELKEVEEDGDDEAANSKADRLSACEKNLKDMEAILGRKTANVGRDDTPGAPFLINPRSFTQTVENIFTFSFLVKKGKAEIGIRENPGLGETKGLYVAPRNNTDGMVPKQSVVGFTVRDWVRLRDGLNVAEGDLPHRATKIRRRSKKG
jgi:hypothetical protein